MAITKEQKLKKCKPKKKPKCRKSEFGCCPDNKTPAMGPFSKGKKKKMFSDGKNFKNYYHYYYFVIFQVARNLRLVKNLNLVVVSMVFHQLKERTKKVVHRLIVMPHFSVAALIKLT